MQRKHFHSVSLLSCSLLLSSGIALTTSTAAQRVERVRSDSLDVDSYTAGNKRALRRAGYVSLGPFPWLDDHTTTDLERRFPSVRFRWVETAHFRIGSTLDAVPAPASWPARGKMIDRLRRLKRKLPRVKPRTKVLDAWLRLHYLADELERLYSDFSKTLGVKDSDFPDRGKRKGAYRGRGRYLGMRTKYHVLLFAKMANVARYVELTTDDVNNPNRPRQLSFSQEDALLFVTSPEFQDGALQDQALFMSHLTFSAIGMLVDGYKHYNYDLPAWLREGIGHCYVRRLDPTARCFRGMLGGVPKDADEVSWPRAVKNLAVEGTFIPAAKLLPIHDPSRFDLEHHMMAWSRVEFLMRRPKRFAKFMDILKTKLPVHTGVIPDWDVVLAQQTRALREAFRMDAAAFDRAWRAHARQYRKTKRMP